MARIQAEPPPGPERSLSLPVTRVQIDSHWMDCHNSRSGTASSPRPPRDQAGSWRCYPGKQSLPLVAIVGLALAPANIGVFDVRSFVDSAFRLDCAHDLDLGPRKSAVARS